MRRNQRLLGAVCWIATLTGCEGKQHIFAQPSSNDGGSVEVSALVPGGAGSGDTTHDGEPSPNAPGSLGAACTADADCDGPGLCVDGVCCSSACEELCAACNLAESLGSCSAAPSDVDCAPPSCAGQSTDCREVDASQLELNCESAGVCRSNAECAVFAQPAGTPCQAATGTCNGDGACIVPGKASLGQTCTVAADCAEGHCLATGDSGGLICCDTACDGPCQTCGSGGHCEDMDCGNGCDVSTDLCNALIPIGGSCGSPSQCEDEASCLLDQNGQTRCCERNCADTGEVCNESGLCRCLAGRELADGRCRVIDGQECQQAADCASRVCTDWYVDFDFDGFGTDSTRISTCGNDAPRPFVDVSGCTGQNGGAFSLNYVTAGRDCCDLNTCGRLPGLLEQMSSVFHPAQTVPGRGNEACGTSQFDRNCDGNVTVANAAEIPPFSPGCVGNSTSCTGSGRTTQAEPRCQDTISIRFCGILTECAQHHRRPSAVC